MENDFFCILLGFVFGNYRKKNFRTRRVFYKRRDGTKMLTKVARLLEFFKQELDMSYERHKREDSCNK